MGKRISRRTFLKGTAASAVGIAAAGGLITACTNKGNGSGTSKSAASGERGGSFEFTGVDSTYGSFLNPQEDFSADSGDYSPLFKPLKLGGKTMKNRLVKSSAGSEMQRSNEWPDDNSLFFYEQFCKGGIGMICFEPSTVMPKAFTEGGKVASVAKVPEDAGFLDITSDAGLPAHRAIADYIHKYDVLVIAQMLDLMMPRGGASSYFRNDKLELAFSNGVMQTTEEVQEEIGYFIEAAVRYQKAGFDGIEINASCNHYFSTFLSRLANHERTDQYSGETIENRARVVTEIIEGIRKRVGDDFIIQVLYSGIEENVYELGDNSLCISLGEACEFARLFELAGASCLHIRAQAYGNHTGGFMPDMSHYFEHGDTGYNAVIDYKKHFGGKVLGQYQGYGALLEVAAEIKKHVSIPVGTVGGMDPNVAPDLINNAVRDGRIDYILMTRALMADPAIANKLKEGKRDEVAACARCMTCFVAPFGLGLPMYCRVNPSITRAYGPDMPEGYAPAPAHGSKKVLVVGGGPAGMEAARIAAQRGHQVSLYEKGAALGGRLDFVQRLKGPHERIEDHRRYLSRQLEIHGVQVHLNEEVDVELVKGISPDAVIVAVGGSFSSLDVPGGDQGGILDYGMMEQSLTSYGRLSTGDRVVIVGAQFQACETAAHLARLGKTVTMLNIGPEGDFYQNGAIWPKVMGRPWLSGKGVKVYHNVTLKEIKKDRIVFDTEYGLPEAIVYDDLIQALPMLTNRTLYDSLSEVCHEVYAVGDCYSPNTIANATARANVVARKIGSGKSGAHIELAHNQYSATATGIGDVTVIITVDEGRITDAIVDTSNESGGIGKDLGGTFARQIVESGGTGVDAVSGASVTVEAVQEALKKCKQKAGIKE